MPAVKLADAYRALGLDPGASSAAVTAAYRDGARTAHPDAGGDAAAFAALREAYGAALRDALDREAICAGCKGLGYRWARAGFYAAKEPCAACGGRGRVS